MLPLVEPLRSQILQILKKICIFFSSGCNFSSFQYFLDRLDVLGHRQLKVTLASTGRYDPPEKMLVYKIFYKIFTFFGILQDHFTAPEGIRKHRKHELSANINPKTLDNSEIPNNNVFELAAFLQYPSVPLMWWNQ